MQPLGESLDVVEVVRSLVTRLQSLQKIVAGQEARLQVLEGGCAAAADHVGDLVVDEQPAAPGPEVAASRTEKPGGVPRAKPRLVRPNRKA